MKAAAPLDTRGRRIRLIHTGCRELGIGEDERRAIQHAATGKTSCKIMSVPELQRVIDELNRRGFCWLRGSTQRRKPGPPLESRLPDSVYTGKLRALWVSAFNLGCVDNSSDVALAAWLRYQTGMDSAAWCIDEKTAGRCVEALKLWLAKPVGKDGGGVQWDRWPDNPKLAVLSAIIAYIDRTRANAERPGLVESGAIWTEWEKSDDLDALALRLGCEMRDWRSGKLA